MSRRESQRVSVPGDQDRDGGRRVRVGQLRGTVDPGGLDPTSRDIPTVGLVMGCALDQPYLGRVQPRDIVVISGYNGSIVNQDLG